MMTTYFKEKLREDLDRFSPSPALIECVSAMMREEAEKPRKSPFGAGVRFVGLAAAVVLLSFGAIGLGVLRPIGVAEMIETGETITEAAGENPSQNKNAEALDESGIAAYSDEFWVADEPAALADEPMITARAIGGDELALYYALADQSIARIDGGIIRIVGEEAFEEWRIGKEANAAPTDLAEDVNLYALICDFPDEKEAIRARLTELAVIDRENGWEVSLTDEEIALLCDGERDAVAAYFVSPAAVYANGKIYSPAWLDAHTVADYTAEAIPPEALREKLDEILYFSSFLDLSELAAKLGEYLGEPIALPTDQGADEAALGNIPAIADDPEPSETVGDEGVEDEPEEALS
ncbi:MAG: hypothetical protein NC084_07500 [Bacteroides sp.]|nr:hypothetical protein [Eubacterium sp.]MCM1417509.1 hypothetical protein [Roseburia sp.]MCM1462544.1 hypothetical protein [Bacteroides sp.]